VNRHQQKVIDYLLEKHGLEPAPARSKRTSWRAFLESNWDTLAAADFFTVEVRSLGGSVIFYILFFMEI